ncbi:HupE/UreJ family protein [Pseudoduganella eburnea]|uniref:HupE/UreJ family protein n=1 Tax=Massilia eburnea TaxID=1776165 RepID=A0A6L6QDH3_9BURK|nr:HupE/UreJ family protein [Massilia eburnea]MTW10240.1 HupE/UreJ family protein [Massilia eburnea]
MNLRSHFVCSLAALLFLLAAGAAEAHKPSDSYLTLRVTTTAAAGGVRPSGAAVIEGRWDIALRDLDFVLGLDADGDGRLTWDEVRFRHADIAGYAVPRLGLASGCRLQVAGNQVDRHTDGAYAVLLLRGACQPGAPFAIDYKLFADIDAQHRGMASITVDGQLQSLVLGGDSTRFVADSEAVGGPVPGAGRGASGLWRQAGDYLQHGVWHIWTGYDHILFLLSLLLPAVLGKGWRPASADVLRVVTAFTLAHSVTLSLAALHVLALPSRLIESAIAASVAVAALNNIWPVVRGKRWLAALAFGLLHGFGFAGVLGDLGLPKGAAAVALASFNIGVELGQLAIVAAFVPLAYAMRSTWMYRQVMVKGGSACVALLATVWLLERASA